MANKLHGDVYNDTKEVQGFKVDGSNIAQLKKLHRYTTDYPTSDKSIETIISIPENIKLIKSNKQYPLFSNPINGDVEVP